MNSLAALPELIPHVIAWAHIHSQSAQQVGAALNEDLLDLARKVGVAHPQAIRIQMVDALPLPTEPTLRAAAVASGFSGPGLVGLTLGHSIFIVHGRASRRLLAHEFRHVHQYKALGSIEDFFRVYLPQVASLGYEAAPLEVDARAYEIVAYPSLEPPPAVQINR